MARVTMRLQRGEKVREGPQGGEMEVVASSERLAICRWEADGQMKQGVFEVGGLSRVIAAQQQQQPQPLERQGND